MSVVLKNPKLLNDYIERLVYHGGNVDTFTPDQMKNPDFINENRDKVISAMTYQWMKIRVRDFLLNDTDKEFLKSVGKNEYGDNLYDFLEQNLPGSFANDIQNIRDYFYSVSDIYINKQLDLISKEKEEALKKQEAYEYAKSKGKNPKKPKEIKYSIKLDFLKNSPDLSNFEKGLEASKKWHDEILRQAQENDMTEEALKKSKEGTKEILKFDDGYVLLQLLTSQSLDYESEMMGHCVGKGAYDKNVEEGNIQIYSIRDGKGNSHVTFEVRNGDVLQCKGKGNKAPVQKYIPFIQETVLFLNLNPERDLSNMGFIRDVNNKLYDLYNLPKNFECKEFRLEAFDMESINIPDGFKAENFYLSFVSNLQKDLDLSGVKEVTLRHFNLYNINLKFGKNERVYIINVRNLSGKIDFSNVDNLELRNIDLSEADIKFPNKKESSVNIEEVENLSGKIDFSNVDNLKLTGVDLSQTDIKFPNKKESSVNIEEVKNLPDNLDLKNIKYISISNSDLSDVKNLNFPEEEVDLYDVKLPLKVDFSKVKKIYLKRSLNLPNNIDFSQSKKIFLEKLDLKDINIKFPNNEDNIIILDNIKNLPKILDFSNVKDFSLLFSDLKGVDIKLPKVGCLNLSSLENLPQNLDFSEITDLGLSNIEERKNGFDIKWPNDLNAKVFFSLIGDKIYDDYWNDRATKELNQKIDAEKNNDVNISDELVDRGR